MAMEECAPAFSIESSLLAHFCGLAAVVTTESHGLPAHGFASTKELFIGMKGAETPLHFDERENLFFQARFQLNFRHVWFVTGHVLCSLWMFSTLSGFLQPLPDQRAQGDCRLSLCGLCAALSVPNHTPMRPPAPCLIWGCPGSNTIKHQGTASFLSVHCDEVDGGQPCGG